MPTVVSFIRSNAYRTQPNGSAGEGEIFNTTSRRWEEPDCRQKELMMGYRLDETACPNITDEQRSIRLGRALDANVMYHLGAMLAAAHA